MQILRTTDGRPYGVATKRFHTTSVGVDAHTSNCFTATIILTCHPERATCGESNVWEASRTASEQTRETEGRCGISKRCPRPFHAKVTMANRVTEIDYRSHRRYRSSVSSRLAIAPLPETSTPLRSAQDDTNIERWRKGVALFAGRRGCPYGGTTRHLFPLGRGRRPHE